MQPFLLGMKTIIPFFFVRDPKWKMFCQPCTKLVKKVLADFPVPKSTLIYSKLETLKIFSYSGELLSNNFDRNLKFSTHIEDICKLTDKFNILSRIVPYNCCREKASTHTWFYLSLSWRRPLSYRSQSIDLPSKSMDWLQYDKGLPHERVKRKKYLWMPFLRYCSIAFP